MQVWDYLRLASAGLWQRKGQTIKIILIIGVIFAFIIAVELLVWGAEDMAVKKINQPVGDKILLVTEIDAEICKEDCKEQNNAKIKENIERYGGEVINQAGSFRTKTNEAWNVLPEEVLRPAIEVNLENIPQDIVPILIPTRLAIEWLGLIDYHQEPIFDENTGTFNIGPEANLNTIEQAREQSLGKMITSPEGEMYFVVGFLPSDVTSRFSISTNSDILNLFISGTTVGRTELPIVVDGRGLQKQKWQLDDSKVWATFSSAGAVYKYYADDDNFCGILERGQNSCPESYKYLVSSPFGFELEERWGFQSAQNFFKMVVGILGVLAIIVNVITLVRVMERDTNNIALYYVMGANKNQVHMVQSLRVLLMCLLAVIFALLVGVIVCFGFNFVQAGTLAEAYALAFGALEEPVVLFEVKWQVLIFIGMIFIVAPVVILLTWKTTAKSNSLKDMKTEA